MLIADSKRMFRLPEASKYFIFGIPFHLFIFFLPSQSQLSSDKKTFAPVEINVQVKDESNAVDPSPKEFSEAPKKTSTTQKSVPAEKVVRSLSRDPKAQGTASVEIKSYKQLLPSPSEISNADSPVGPSLDGISSAKHRWADSLNIEEKRVLINKADRIRAKIDFPLSARSASETGKATARLSRTSPDGKISLNILQGRPLLRAVLFESLNKAETRQSILEIFDTLGVKEFVIAVHLVKGDHLTANEDSYEWRDNRLDIFVTKGRRAFAKGGGLSVTLPDEKADRAREADEHHFKRLKDSPAYLSILTNREI